MDPADRTFYDELFAIEMQALEDAVAAEPEPGRGTFPPSLEERRRMRYQYIKVGRMFRDTKKWSGSFEISCAQHGHSCLNIWVASSSTL